jgi:hypothetical protein
MTGMPRSTRLARLGFLIFLRQHPALRPLWRETVWGKAPDEAESADMTSLRRGLYPVIDISIFLVGLGGYFGRVPALSELYDDAIVDILCIALCALATMAFIGVTVPRFWPMELFGKIMIYGGLVLYEFALLVIIVGLIPVAAPENRLYIVGGALAIIAIVAWRLNRLAIVWTASIVEKVRKKQEARLQDEADNAGER